MPTARPLPAHCPPTARPLPAHCPPTARPLPAYCPPTARLLPAHCPPTARPLPTERGTAAHGTRDHAPNTCAGHQLTKRSRVSASPFEPSIPRPRAHAPTSRKAATSRLLHHSATRRRLHRTFPNSPHPSHTFALAPVSEPWAVRSGTGPTANRSSRFHAAMHAPCPRRPRISMTRPKAAAGRTGLALAVTLKNRTLPPTSSPPSPPQWTKSDQESSSFGVGVASLSSCALSYFSFPFLAHSNLLPSSLPPPLPPLLLLRSVPGARCPVPTVPRPPSPVSRSPSPSPVSHTLDTSVALYLACA
ncbi:hypothetical protein PMIN01_02396 [Paraphaeosphaeria minitans]|uniref:Uncharacterized protein n=1 Tax=Paraphaeosphaeria minitans TaxID=565426 RepID=A0A9P6KUV6_9PLEO|nr:hypothetical protein PMIN01_02396 [Paraphaeosphaeria minitans]